HISFKNFRIGVFSYIGNDFFALSSDLIIEKPLLRIILFAASITIFIGRKSSISISFGYVPSYLEIYLFTILIFERLFFFFGLSNDANSDLPAGSLS